MEAIKKRLIDIFAQLNQIFPDLDAEAHSITSEDIKDMEDLSAAVDDTTAYLEEAALALDNAINAFPAAR